MLKTQLKLHVLKSLFVATKIKRDSIFNGQKGANIIENIMNLHILPNAVRCSK